MNLYGRRLRDLSRHSCQPQHYQFLLKEEALMRFCAQQAQEQIRDKKAILEKDLPDKTPGLSLVKDNC